jgi:hypothetical protein
MMDGEMSERSKSAYRLSGTASKLVPAYGPWDRAFSCAEAAFAKNHGAPPGDPARGVNSAAPDGIQDISGVVLR